MFFDVPYINLFIAFLIISFSIVLFWLFFIIPFLLIRKIYLYLKEKYELRLSNKIS
jgi:hypothetical protein